MNGVLINGNVVILDKIADITPYTPPEQRPPGWPDEPGCYINYTGGGPHCQLFLPGHTPENAARHLGIRLADTPELDKTVYMQTHDRAAGKLSDMSVTLAEHLRLGEMINNDIVVAVLKNRYPETISGRGRVTKFYAELEGKPVSMLVIS